MKLSQLKTIVKEAVKEAIQEEMKDILLEAVRTPKQVVHETMTSSSNPLPENDRATLRENMMNVLDGMRPGANGTLNANTNNVPLQVTSTDTMNGSLPQGEVNMDQIMGLMNKK
tara:strand:+ start:811 stop:1152 length:342 start_codon:yes stop_codon:yes gene_type:complete